MPAAIARLVCAIVGHRWSNVRMACDRCPMTREQLHRAGPPDRKRLP